MFFLFTVTKDQAMKLLEEHKEKVKKDPTAAAQFLCENAKILPNHSAAVSGKSGKVPNRPYLSGTLERMTHN